MECGNRVGKRNPVRRKLRIEKTHLGFIVPIGRTGQYPGKTAQEAVLHYQTLFIDPGAEECV